MAPLLVISLCVLISGCLAENQDLTEARASGDINLSDLYASPYFGPLVIITLFVFVDIFLMIAMVGETQQKRRVFSPSRPQRHNHAARGHHYRQGQHPYYGGGVGRMGDAEGEDEIDELQSLDWVDSTFGLINIESQVCRERAICELERKASENAFFGFIVKNLNSYVNGLDKYERAIDEGLNGRSCEEIFAECPYSLSQPSSWNLFSKK